MFTELSKGNASVALILSCLTALLLTPLAAVHAAPQIPPPTPWAEYDPAHMDFKEEIVNEETR